MTTDLSGPPSAARPLTPARGRAAVFATAAATFTVVTTEMLPVGLLSPLGAGLGVLEGTAGLAVTLPGVVAAVTAPLFPTLAGRLDRRSLLCGLLLLLAAANLVSALAPSFGVLLAARVAVGVAIGGVWTVAAGLAHRLVPAPSVARATAVVFSGIAVASVLGIPAGALIGDVAGWRWGFAAVGALAVLVAVLHAVLLPPLPAGAAVRPREMTALLGLPALRTGLLVVALLVTGHFAAYTYVRPVLERVDGIDAGALSALLLCYGVAGVIGNFVAGTVAGRSPRRSLLGISAVLALVVPLLAAAAGNAVLSVVLLVAWGLAYGGVSVSAQSWLVGALGDGGARAREAASGLFAGVFNSAIALGAAVGGGFVDALGEASVLVLAGTTAAVALALLALRPTGRRTTG
ncbi:MFS transporter [Streptomyces sp. NPDC059578]|uniref:MFS transporter n=1 Tax=unclassified Streptomyces TaxID=2593676 RepID=UPI00364E219C